MTLFQKIGTNFAYLFKMWHIFVESVSKVITKQRKYYGERDKK